MTENILNWNEIQETYKDSTILIGNGASIAISDNFSYQNILELIKNIDKYKTIETLFEYFKSKDFELILRKLSHAEDINGILKIDDNKENIIRTKRKIQSILIQAIRTRHPPYSKVEAKLESFYNFIKYFKRIISLNYDLLIYWTIMKGIKIPDGYAIKDCFTVDNFLNNNNNEFDHEWSKYKDPNPNIAKEKYSKLVFYLHGNIALALNEFENEVKITSNMDNLLETINEYWKDHKNRPIFVSEGTAEQKKQAIKRSPYLSTVFDEVLQNLPNNYLTIYGFKFGEQDLYILEQIAKNKNKIVKVAVSVHKDGKEADYFSKVKKNLKKHLNITDNNIEFFDSATVGDWSKKIDETSDTTTYQQPAPTLQKCDIFQ